MPDLLPTIAQKLADALKRQGGCQCQTRGMWPWKREHECLMHEALREWNIYRSIVQLPGAQAGEK